MVEKIGIQTFTIRKDIKSLGELEGTLRYYRKLGIKQFELSRLNFSKDELQVLSKLKEELELEYSASQITLKKIITDFDFMMDFSKELDIKYLEVSVIPFKNFIKGKNGIIALGKKLNALGMKTKEYNVRLLYHHHNYELIKFDKKLSLDVLMENTDEELVNLVCDTYWLARSGYNPAKFIEDRINRIKGVHLRDNILKYKRGKFFASDTTIGEGTIDFDSIIKLDKYSLIDFYSIEQDTDCPKEHIEQGYNHMKKLIEKAK